MPLAELLAMLACAVLAGLVIFQVALIAGAPLGRMAWGGNHRVLPAKLRVGSALSVVIYGVLAYTALAKAGLVAPVFNESFTAKTVWVMAVYFVFGAIMNAISRSRLERLVMTPTTLILATIYLILAVQRL